MVKLIGGNLFYLSDETNALEACECLGNVRAVLLVKACECDKGKCISAWLEIKTQGHD